jgi:hypothetical protein
MMLLTATLCRHFNVAAQVQPQYFCGDTVYRNGIVGAGSLDFPLSYGFPNDTNTKRFQLIYKPKWFKCGERGQIKYVYVRNQGRYPVTFPHFEIALGYTSNAEYRAYRGPGGKDTFIEAVTVFSANNYTMPSDSYINWVRIPLNKANFFYDTSRNLVLEIRSGPPSPKTFFRFAMSAGLQDTGYRTFINGTMSSPYTAPYSSLELLIDFGFDIQPVGVPAVPGASPPPLMVYPNPAGSSLWLPAAAAGWHYEVMDMAGRVVQRGTVPADTELSIEGLGPGSYLLRVVPLTGAWPQTVRFTKQ